MNNISKTEPIESVVPLKRTRAKRSCDFCRKRKARCDADHTIPCSNCKAWGYSCEFLTVCRKRGPPSVHVKNLEIKCRKMELLLSSLTKLSIQELEKKDYCLDSNIIASIAEKKTEMPQDIDENDDDDNLSEISEDASMCEDENNHPNIEDTFANLNIEDYDSLKYTGQSAWLQLFDRNLFTSKNTLHLPGREDVLLKLMPENELLVIRSGQYHSGKNKQNARLDVGFSLNSSIFDEKQRDIQQNPSDSPVSKRTLPSEKLIEKAYHLYFTHIHTFLPLLNRKRFETHDKKSSTILSQAVLAVTFRFAARHFPKLFNTKKANLYAETYYTKVSARLQDSHRTRLRHVQAALLMTLYLDMDETDVESMQWFTLGKAIRMAQDIGLHRSCSNWNLPPSEIETRHRVFYSCYILDRLMGARAGKPLTILDRDFDTDLPKTYEVNDDDNEIGPPIYQSFVCLVKLAEIYGRVLKALYAPKSKPSNTNAGLDDPTILAVLDRRLKNWKKSLDCTKMSQAQKVNLLLFYYTSMLLLHRPFLSPSNLYETTSSIASESLLACENAALNISVIIRQKQLLMTDPDSYAPLCLPTCFVYSMFQSSLVHIAIVLQNRHSQRQLESLKRSIMLLEQYEKFVSARRACNILHMLVKMNCIQLDSVVLKNTLPHSPVSLVKHEIEYVGSQVDTLDDNDLTFDDNEQVPKSTWYMRMMNPSIIGGITEDLHYHHHQKPSYYQLLPTTSQESNYFSYQPSSSFPTTTTKDKVSENFLVFDDTKNKPEHHYPLDPKPGLAPFLHQTPQSFASSSSYLPIPTTVSPAAGIYSTVPSSLNWNEWDTYLNQHNNLKPYSAL